MAVLLFSEGGCCDHPHRAFNLTLKNEWPYPRAYTSNQARLDALETFVHDYNHHRGHTAHHGDVPMSQRSGATQLGRSASAREP